MSQVCPNHHCHRSFGSGQVQTHLLSSSAVVSGGVVGTVAVIVRVTAYEVCHGLGEAVMSSAVGSLFLGRGLSSSLLIRGEHLLPNPTITPTNTVLPLSTISNGLI